ncbi:helix-turn-helix transcriptional regulator [Larkinella bovis]|uniref:Helix-turn-helix transcriptional regulator n=1 Tax=Larkinella bovis TaxID=683041 RepID=A0ABW0IAF7_9BACT
MIALQTGDCLGERLHFFQGNGISLNRTAYPANERTAAMHYHPEAHISFVLQGGNVERRKATQLERGPGSVTFYHAGEAHQTIQKRFPAQHINLEIAGTLLKQYQLSEDVLGQGILKNPNVALTMIRLYKECIINDNFLAPSVGMLLVALTPDKVLKTVKPRWVERIEELLQDSWNQPLTLQDLALETGIHPVTISKYFPRYFHCTLGEYIRTLRVSKALQLMRTSTLSLTEIAYLCGFADQSHFSRTFQQLTGFTPKRYQHLGVPSPG